MNTTKRRGVGVLAMVLALALAGAPPGRAEDAGPPPAAAAITGRVLNVEDRPVPGATVVGEFYGRKGRRALGTVVADAAGNFGFDAVPAPEQAHSGPHFCFMARVPGAGVGFGHAARAGENVEVRLTLPVRLTVPVVDAGGKPLPGVLLRVTFLNPSTRTGFNEPPDFEAGRLEARTDAAGRAVLTDLPAGSEVEFAVADDRWAPASPEAATRWLPLGAGPETLASAPLVLVPAACVAGAVRYSAPDHRPGADLPVALLNAHRGGIGNARTDAQGRYEFKGVPPGVYDVLISLDDHGEEANWTAHPRERITVSAGQTLDGQDLTLIPGALVAGRVIVPGDGEGQDGVAGMGVSVRTRTSGWAPSRYTRTDAQGRYHLRVPGGQQHVSLSSRLPAGLAASEPAKVDLEVADGAEAKVDFVLRRADAGDFITGEVLDPAGRPVAGARVLLALRRGWLFDAPQPTTGADGRFRLPRPRSSQPGDEVLALVSAEAGRLATAEPVVVRGGEPARITLSAAGLATVRGQVTDAAGQPVGGARVQASAHLGDFPNDRPQATTDAEGRFLLGELWPGTDYMFSVEAKRHGGDLLRGVSLRAGEERELKFDPLAPTDRAVAGRVLGSDGQPRPGVGVTANARDNRGEATTDGEGRFRITGLTDGWVSFDLQVNGYHLPDRLRARTGEENVVLELPDGNGRQVGENRAPENLGKLLGQIAPLPVAATAGSWLNLPAGGAGPVDVAGLVLGKAVMLDFWGLQCGSCLKALPQIEAFWQANRGRGLVVLGVGSQRNPPAEVREWLERHPGYRVTYPLALDPRDRTVALYGLQGLPAYAVVNRDGRLEYLGHEWKEATRRAEALLDPPTPPPLP